MASVTCCGDNFGLLTPETTLERATVLNNAFQCLWRKAKGEKQRQELDQAMTGFVDYYNRLRDSFWIQFTEYGEIQKWEQKYQDLLEKFSLEQNYYIECPVIMPGETPFIIPENIEVEADSAIKKAQETGDKLTRDLENAYKKIILYSMGSMVLGGVVIWLLSRRRK